MTFSPLSDSVLRAIRDLDTRVIRTLREDLRDVVRAYIENGLRDGRGPRDIARGLRDVIGMAPYQEQNLANRIAEWTDAGYDQAKIDRMTAAYRRKAIAINAETNARTAALDAQKLGQHLAWQQQVEAGEIDGGTLMKRWSGTLDDRERLTHLAMEGETVPWDQPYSNGQMQPGDNEFNCRCVSIYSTAPGVASGVRPSPLAPVLVAVSSAP